MIIGTGTLQPCGCMHIEGPLDESLVRFVWEFPHRVEFVAIVNDRGDRATVALGAVGDDLWPFVLEWTDDEPLQPIAPMDIELRADLLGVAEPV